MRTLAILTLAAAGCRGGKGAARPLPTTTPYLMLFEQGRSWSLPSPGGPVTCTVAAAKQVGDASVSRLDCGSLLVSGTWVATPAGLYHPHLPIDEPDELALLGDDDLLITRNPAEREHSHALPGGAHDAIEAFGFEGSWCVRQTTASPRDRRSYTLCFDGTDITGGSDESTSGDASERSTFGNAPPADHEDSDD